MGSLSGGDFEKKRHCPSSEALVFYRQRYLPDGQMSQLASHLAACDFCAAELELLSRFPSTKELCDSPKMPPHLRALAESVLRMDRRNNGFTAGCS